MLMTKAARHDSNISRLTIERTRVSAAAKTDSGATANEERPFIRIRVSMQFPRAMRFYSYIGSSNGCRDRKVGDISNADVVIWRLSEKPRREAMF
jgi:hypothetical protein